MARVLCVGVATLDVVHVVGEYPPEDGEVRAHSQNWCRGGNATNLLVVLRQLGHEGSWLGTLADDAGAAVIRDDLRRHGIDFSAARVHPACRSPSSCILTSRATGSRTIVHYRDLPELHADELRRVNLRDYDWLHFEGRNVEQTTTMLEHAARLAPQLPRSVEVEKPRDDVERLFPLADALLFSRGYAERRGYGEPRKFLEATRAVAPQADLICAWGSQGAVGLDRLGEFASAEAFVPERVLDTRGAGDVFNAAYLDAALRGAPFGERLWEACRLAGHKCGRYGLDDLLEGF